MFKFSFTTKHRCQGNDFIAKTLYIKGTGICLVLKQLAIMNKQ